MRKRAQDAVNQLPRFVVVRQIDSIQQVHPVARVRFHRRGPLAGSQISLDALRRRSRQGQFSFGRVCIRWPLRIDIDQEPTTSDDRRIIDCVSRDARRLELVHHHVDAFDTLDGIGVLCPGERLNVAREAS
jgi:hypothetical protein